MRRCRCTRVAPLVARAAAQEETQVWDSLTLACHARDVIGAKCAVTSQVGVLGAHTVCQVSAALPTLILLSPAQQASPASLSSSEEELRPPKPVAVPPEWENAQQLQRDGTTYRTVIRSVNRVRSLARLQRRLPAAGRACSSSRADRVGCMGLGPKH